MPPADRPIHDIIEECRGSIRTPYYLIDEARLVRNLETIARVREQSGARSVLALKCFSTWALFDLMRPYLDGTTSSSPYEARLGAERMGKEVHAYSVAFTEDEVRVVQPLATKIIFNSLSQLRRFRHLANGTALGLRINPGISHSDYPLADPTGPRSRLGVRDARELDEAAAWISGAMFHCNCENADVERFAEILAHIGSRFERLLHRLDWVSLGGGISFTRPGYPLDAFCAVLREFADRFGVQVYLEPGDAAVSYAGFLVTEVLDVVHNEGDIAIVDAGTEPHLLDVLVYRMTARMEPMRGGTHRYTVAGRTCLAGDVFGTYDFPEPLRVGSLIPFADAAAYTMVKKNWFNGLPMPSIVVRRLDGRMDVVRTFGYDDYVRSLS